MKASVDLVYSENILHPKLCVLEHGKFLEFSHINLQAMFISQQSLEISMRYGVSACHI